MIYGSVCSGIEAATVAWHPLGWTPAFFSEIDAFPRAVLGHHYPETPLHGDFTTIQAGDYRPIDLLVGGTPCQSFSIAGLRKGLDDERGNLALEYLRLADRLRPKWLVWENVPGVLSSSGGRDFGAFLGGLVELGYGFAYRVLDAQFFGVAQRRRRVFVVGYLGDWRPAAAVLFERHSLSGHPAPRRATGQGTAADAAPSLTASGRGVERTGESRGQDPVVAVAWGGNTSGPVNVSTTLNASAGRVDFESETFITPITLTERGRDGESSLEWRQDGTSNAVLTPGGGRGGMGVGAVCATGEVFHTLRADGFDASEDGTGRGGGAIAWSIMPQNSGRDYKARAVEVAQPLMAGRTGAGGNQGGDIIQTVAGTLGNRGLRSHTELDGHGAYIPVAQPVATAMQVRRLTPTECERLQGFPDGYTAITYRNKLAADGPRYKALGNSMAVPVMAWIGRRIEAVNTLINQKEAA